MTCDLCLAFSPRTNANRECCQIRAIAGMPRARRQEVYTSYGAKHGATALESLQQKVKAEYQRKKDAKNENAGAGNSRHPHRDNERPESRGGRDIDASRDDSNGGSD